MNCLPDSGLAIDYQIDGDIHSELLIVLAHGAGANMHHSFMAELTQLLVAQGHCVYRFNFPYMQANMQDGKKRPPDRAPKLLAHLEHVLADIQHQIADGKLKSQHILFIGKSMGSRMMATFTSKSHVCDNQNIADMVSKVIGQVCLGYPFVPIKKQSPPRLAPLNDSSMPTLILQGERDKFGLPSQIATWDLAEHVNVEFITDGDHSFSPRKSSGTTFDANLVKAVELICQFIKKIDSKR